MLSPLSLFEPKCRPYRNPPSATLRSESAAHLQTGELCHPGEVDAMLNQRKIYKVCVTDTSTATLIVLFY